MIYDCFIFFNELDLLEIRLNVLGDVVDKFVLVEATKTHTGKPKPLHYQDNKKRFADFADKIIHIIVDDFPEPPSNYTPRQASWMRENFQRNAILRGLSEAKPDDLILISDLDEIPCPQSVVAATRFSKGVTALGLEVFCYYLNFKNYTHYEINCTRATRFGEISNGKLRIPANANLDSIVNGGNTMTNVRYSTPTRLLHKAGWHFSYLGGAEAIVNKIGSIAIEYANEKNTNAKWIAQTIEKGEDITGCGGRYFVVPLDERFPRYIRDNRTRFSSLVYEPDAGYYRRNRWPRIESFVRGWIRKNGAKLIPRPFKDYLYHNVYCKLVKEPIAT